MLPLKLPNLYKIRFFLAGIWQALTSEWVNSGTQMLLRSLTSQDAVLLFKAWNLPALTWQLNMFNSSSSRRSFKHTPSNPCAVWGRWNSQTASMWFCCICPTDKLNLSLIRIFAVRWSCEQNKAGESRVWYWLLIGFSSVGWNRHCSPAVPSRPGYNIHIQSRLIKGKNHIKG